MKTLNAAESPPNPDGKYPSMHCCCVTKFHHFFHRTFYKIGYFIGNKPSYFIIIPVFLTLIGLTGVQRIHVQKDPNYLFVPTDGLCKYTRDTIEELFPMNSTHSFDPSRMTRATDFAKLLITTKDNDTILRTKVWDEVILLDKLVQNITVEMDDETYNYTEICSKWYDECFPNMVYNLDEIMYEVENGSTFISYPIMLFPLVIPLFYGGSVVNETEGILLSMRGVYTTYFLAHDNPRQKQIAHIWEGKLLTLLDEIEFEYIRVDRYASRSLTDELAKNGECLMNLLPIAVVLLFFFSLLSVSSSDWVRSKTQMGILGLFTIIMAVSGSFGALMYIGIPYVMINSAVPFLILGIGLDDMFIILSAWRKTKIQDPVPLRLAETYSTTAVSVTITSLTTVVSFFVGTISPFPAARIFCIYLGTSVFFAYLWFLSFFGACLAIVGQLENHQKHIITYKTVKAKSQSDKGYCYRIWCAGGIDQRNPWNVIDNRPDRISTFFRDSYGEVLTRPKAKLFVFACFFVYIGGAIYGTLNLKHGVDRRNFALDGSYLTKYYETEDELFRKYPYRIQVVVRGNMSFYDDSAMESLLNLQQELEDTQFVGPKIFTRSWIRGFNNYLRRRPQLKANITDEVAFIKELDNEYLSPGMRERLDVRYSKNKTRIEAIRFVLQGYEVRNMEEDFEMIRSLREIAEKSQFEVLIYHPSFVYYDQYLALGPSALKIVGLSATIVVLISLLFIWNPLSALWIGLSIISINFGVVGYMALWGVRLDTVALINLIMCIGFSVDYSAHISFSFLKSSGLTSRDKVRDSLFKMGLPVIQSGTSTVLAIIVLVFTPSYTFRSFFKILLLVTLFGMFHSLVLLPVLLSIFCRNNDIDQNNPGKNEQIIGNRYIARNTFSKYPTQSTSKCTQPAVASRESSLSSNISSTSSSSTVSGSISNCSVSSLALNSQDSVESERL